MFKLNIKIMKEIILLVLVIATIIVEIVTKNFFISTLMLWVYVGINSAWSIRIPK